MNYLQNIQRLYNVYGTTNDGFIEQYVLEVENHLKIKFPKVLRDYYLSIGKNAAINNSFNRLLKPGHDISFTSDRYLVFYEENQAVVSWAIKESDLALDNPCVYGNYDMHDNENEWFVDSPDTESFLLSMALWNGVLGGLSYTANMTDSNGLPSFINEQVKANWVELDGITNQYLRFFTNDFHEIIVLTTDSELRVDGLYIGSNDLNCYLNLIARLPVEWNYRSDIDK